MEPCPPSCPSLRPPSWTNSLGGGCNAACDSSAQGSFDHLDPCPIANSVQWLQQAPSWVDATGHVSLKDLVLELQNLLYFGVLSSFLVEVRDGDDFVKD